MVSRLRNAIQRYPPHSGRGRRRPTVLGDGGQLKSRRSKEWSGSSRIAMGVSGRQLRAVCRRDGRGLAGNYGHMTDWRRF